jgi:8-oxo-dGTP diphosphatase
MLAAPTKELRKAALSVFRHLPVSLRRAAVRAGTPSYTVGAVAVLRRPSGEVLLVHQRHSGRWALPGGLMKRGEKPARGLVRELREELGWAPSGDLEAPTVLVDAHARRVDVIFQAPCVEAVAARDDDPEILDVGWFAPGELPDITGPTAAILDHVGLR